MSIYGLDIELKSQNGVEVREIAGELKADIGPDGAVVGVDIEHMSQRLDLATLETEDLPIGRLKAAKLSFGKSITFPWRPTAAKAPPCIPTSW